MTLQRRCSFVSWCFFCHRLWIFLETAPQRVTLSNTFVANSYSWRHGWRSGWATSCCAACRGFDPRTEQIFVLPTGSCSGSSCLFMWLVNICIRTHYAGISPSRGNVFFFPRKKYVEDLWKWVKKNTHSAPRNFRNFVMFIQQLFS